MGSVKRETANICRRVFCIVVCCAVFSGCRQSPKHLFSGWLGNSESVETSKSDQESSWKLRVTANKIAVEDAPGKVQLGDVGSNGGLPTESDVADSAFETDAVDSFSNTATIRQVSKIANTAGIADPFAMGFIPASADPKPEPEQSIVEALDAKPPMLPQLPMSSTDTAEAESNPRVSKANTTEQETQDIPVRFASKTMVKVRQQIEELRNSARADIRNISRGNVDSGSDGMIVSSNTVPRRIRKSSRSESWDAAIVTANSNRPVTARATDDTSIGEPNDRSAANVVIGVSNANTGAAVQVARTETLEPEVVEVDSKLQSAVDADEPRRIRPVFPSKSVKLDPVAFETEPVASTNASAGWGYWIVIAAIILGLIGFIGILAYRVMNTRQSTADKISS